MFVMFPQLCQNLCLCTIFRQLWTIRCSDTDVYLFSKAWGPLFWIFVIHLTCCVCVWFYLLTPNFILTGISTCSWVIANKVILMPRTSAILNLTFWFFVFFVACGKIFVCILNLCSLDDLWLRYGDIMIFKMAAVCWIFEIGHFHHLTFVCVRLCIQTANFVLIGHDGAEL